MLQRPNYFRDAPWNYSRVRPFVILPLLFYSNGSAVLRCGDALRFVHRRAPIAILLRLAFNNIVENFAEPRSSFTDLS